MKREWDDLIPDDDLETRWKHWVEELEKCGDLVASRSIMPSKSFKSEPNCEVMGFSDGSSVAYGCAVYLRWFDKQESIIDVKFIGAKGKLNSIKGTTIPRSKMCVHSYCLDWLIQPNLHLKGQS